MSLEESIKANRERMAKRRNAGEENRKRFEKEVGGPAFKSHAKSKALEGMKGISNPMEAAKRPFQRKHTPHGEISHSWQVKAKDNKYHA